MDVLRANQLQMDKETCQNIVFVFLSWLVCSCKCFIVSPIFLPFGFNFDCISLYISLQSCKVFKYFFLLSCCKFTFIVRKLKLWALTSNKEILYFYP
jgi:hypothetical protein